MTELLILPGLGDSGPAHWQTYWLKKFDHSTKLVQDDWDNPDLNSWLQRLNEKILELNRPMILVAHSLAVALVAHWVATYKNENVKAALLVAPADVDSPLHTPDEVRNFAPMPLVQFPFPSIVVASDNDTYVSIERAEFFAEKWGSDFITVYSKGHINSDSNLEYWEEGQAILSDLF